MPALSLSSRSHLSAKCQHPARSLLWPSCAQKCSGSYSLSRRCPQLFHIPTIPISQPHTCPSRLMSWPAFPPRPPTFFTILLLNQEPPLVAPQVQTALRGSGDTMILLALPPHPHRLYLSLCQLVHRHWGRLYPTTWTELKGLGSHRCL